MRVKSYYKADLLSFWDLSEEQQKEALERFDSEEVAGCYSYWSSVSQDEWTPDHVLWDTSELMPNDHNYWDCGQQWSNNSFILCHINSSQDEIHVAYRFCDN